MCSTDAFKNEVPKIVPTKYTTSWFYCTFVRTDVSLKLIGECILILFPHCMNYLCLLYLTNHTVLLQTTTAGCTKCHWRNEKSEQIC